MEFEIFKPRQPVELTLKFVDADEAEQLLTSLQTWTPTGGWSEIAKELFKALVQIIES